MKNVTVIIWLLLALAAGIVLLQIYLSKKDSRWPGLILPVISFGRSLVAVFSVAAFTTMSKVSVEQLDENGAVIYEEVLTAPNTAPPVQDTPSLIFNVLSVLLLNNISTIVLLAIYFACREKQRRRKALDKMQVQDLG